MMREKLRSRREAAKQVDSSLSEEQKVVSEKQSFEDTPLNQKSLNEDSPMNKDSKKKKNESLNDDADDGKIDTRIKQGSDTNDLDSEPGTKRKKKNKNRRGSVVNHHKHVPWWQCCTSR